MKAILDALNQTPGILGSSIVQHGLCVVHAFNPPFEPAVITEVAQQFWTVSDLLSSFSEEPPRQLWLEFQEGTLAIRKFATGMLVVGVEKGANPALVYVGMNAAVLKIRRLAGDVSGVTAADITGDITGAMADMVTGNVTGSYKPAPVSRSQSVQAVPDVDRSSDYSGYSADMSTGGYDLPPTLSNVRLPDPTPEVLEPVVASGEPPAIPFDSNSHYVGEAALKHLVRTYARYAGASTARSFREELAGLGATTNTCTLSQYGHLIRRLAGRLKDSATGRQFTREALGDG